MCRMVGDYEPGEFGEDFLEEVIFKFGFQGKSVVTKLKVAQTPFPVSRLRICIFSRDGYPRGSRYIGNHNT